MRAFTKQENALKLTALLTNTPRHMIDDIDFLVASLDRQGQIFKRNVHRTSTRVCRMFCLIVLLNVIIVVPRSLTQGSWDLFWLFYDLPEDACVILYENLSCQYWRVDVRIGPSRRLSTVPQRVFLIFSRQESW